MNPGTVLTTALKVAASLALLWLATRTLDFRRAFAAIDEIRPLWLLAGPLALAAAAAINGLRWRWLLLAHGAEMHVRRAIALLFVTTFFNSGLPSTLGGDAARMVYAVNGGADLAIVAVSTVLDRFAGYSSVILYSAAVVVLAPYGMELPAVWEAVILLLAAVVPIGLAALVALNALPRPERWTQSALAGRTARALAPFLRVRIRVGAVIVAIVVSTPIILLIGAVLAAMNAAICGCYDLSVGRAVAIAGPMMLAVSIPISMAGWGVREVVVVALFGLLGLPPEQGLVTSVLFGLALFVSGLPGVAIWLGLRVSPAKIR